MYAKLLRRIRLSSQLPGFILLDCIYTFKSHKSSPHKIYDEAQAQIYGVHKVNVRNGKRTNKMQHTSLNCKSQRTR